MIETKLLYRQEARRASINWTVAPCPACFHLMWHAYTMYVGYMTHVLFSFAQECEMIFEIWLPLNADGWYCVWLRESGLNYYLKVMATSIFIYKDDTKTYITGALSLDQFSSTNSIVQCLAYSAGLSVQYVHSICFKVTLQSTSLHYTATNTDRCEFPYHVGNISCILVLIWEWQGNNLQVWPSPWSLRWWIREFYLSNRGPLQVELLSSHSTREETMTSSMTDSSITQLRSSKPSTVVESSSYTLSSS